MDYARYNYIAQPGDKMFVLFAKWDRNDHYSCKLGYRVIPNATTPEAEVVLHLTNGF
jgi:hypothetical protein